MLALVFMCRSEANSQRFPDPTQQTLEALIQLELVRNLTDRLLRWLLCLATIFISAPFGRWIFFVGFLFLIVFLLLVFGISFFGYLIESRSVYLFFAIAIFEPFLETVIFNFLFFHSSFLNC